MTIAIRPSYSGRDGQNKPHISEKQKRFIFAARAGQEFAMTSDLPVEAGQEFVCLYRRQNFYAVCRFELPRSFCHQFGTSHKRKLSSTRSRGDRILAQPRRANHSPNFETPCPAPRAKIFRLTRRVNQWFESARLTQERGGSRSSRTLRWDAVDARATTDVRGSSGRRNRVVLAPRRWR